MKAKESGPLLPMGKCSATKKQLKAFQSITDVLNRDRGYVIGQICLPTRTPLTDREVGEMSFHYLTPREGARINVVLRDIKRKRAKKGSKP